MNRLSIAVLAALKVRTQKFQPVAVASAVRTYNKRFYHQNSHSLHDNHDHDHDHEHSHDHDHGHDHDHVTDHKKVIDREALKQEALAKEQQLREEEEEEDMEEMFIMGPSGKIEWGGPTRGGKRPEPTRFGDWERRGRTSDFK